MLDVGECRKIKKECTEKYKGKNIIINVDQYPFVYLIITHGDGKSWGYFYQVNPSFFESAHKSYYYTHRLIDNIRLGRNNAEMEHVHLTYGNNELTSDYKSIVITDNPEINRVYTQILSELHLARDYYNTEIYFDFFFVYNPKLITVLFDQKRLIFHLRGDIDFYRCYIGTSNGNVSKISPKEAFDIPTKWLDVLIDTGVDQDILKAFIERGYDPSDFNGCTSYLLNNFPKQYYSNKEVFKRYVDDFLYRDYLRMRDELPKELRKGFCLLPKDVKSTHDKIILVYNRNLERINQEKLRMKQEDYERNVYSLASKFEYSNDDFSIIACKFLAELITEGNVLHHCVGSYTSSVSKGNEYILFLRRNNDIDKPFFTIDITPDGNVRQIHGLCNCNMSNEIIPFVNEWAKKFNLSLTGCSGVKCALY